MRQDDDNLGDVREALAVALEEKKVNLLDRRLLIIYVLLIVLLTAAGQGYTSLTDACNVNQDNARAINDLIDRAITSTESNETITPKQRAQRVEDYEAIRQAVPSCPPGLW